MTYIMDLLTIYDDLHTTITYMLQILTHHNYFFPIHNNLHDTLAYNLQ